MQLNYDNTITALSQLADHLQERSFSKRMAETYVLDTGYLWKYVQESEMNAPLSFIKNLEQPAGCVSCAVRNGDQLAEGRVGVLLPERDINIFITRLIFASLLTGNKLVVKLPLTLKHSASYFRKLICEHLPGVEFAPVNETAEAFLDGCIAAPDVKTIIAYGDDKWIGQYKNAIRRYNKKLIFGGPAKNPQIVLQNADLEKAVTIALKQGLVNGGQSCLATERFFVHQEVENDFVDMLAERARLIKIGHPLDDDTELGPVHNDAILNNLIALVIEAKHKGARVQMGGRPVEIGHNGGLTFLPTILTGCTTNMQVMQYPAMGPLFPIITFNTEEDLVAKIDQADYGLLASIHGTPSVSLTEYLYRNHYTVCFDATEIITGKVNCQLSEGGFRNSGFIWEWRNNNFIQRDGLRMLVEELAAIRPGCSRRNR